MYLHTLSLNVAIHVTDSSLASDSMVNRANHVPFYQRLYQKNDGVRQWNKVRYVVLSLGRHKVAWSAVHCLPA